MYQSAAIVIFPFLGKAVGDSEGQRMLYLGKQPNVQPERSTFAANGRKGDRYAPSSQLILWTDPIWRVLHYFLEHLGLRADSCRVSVVGSWGEPRQLNHHDGSNSTELRR